MPDTTPVSDLWITGLLSIGLVLATVLFHYEALRIYTRMLEVPGRHPHITTRQSTVIDDAVTPQGDACLTR